MKPVFQTAFGLSGICFAACIASLLELAIDDIPNFCFDNKRQIWIDRLNKWLETKGLAYIQISPDYKELWLDFMVPVYHTIEGKGPRGFKHSVVGKNGIMVHDPHPEAGGIVNVENFGIIICRCNEQKGGE